VSLNNKIQLCYINIKELWQWIEENNLLAQDFTNEKKKWSGTINQEPNFFSDTELMLIYQDIILLKALTDSQANFLAKTYQLEYQNLCQKIFQDNKNIILVSERQWTMDNNSSKKSKEQKKEEKAIVLFKDRESIEKSLVNWLQEPNT